jgi:hypothetical protein
VKTLPHPLPTIPPPSHTKHPLLLPLLPPPLLLLLLQSNTSWIRLAICHAPAAAAASRLQPWVGCVAVRWQAGHPINVHTLPDAHKAGTALLHQLQRWVVREKVEHTSPSSNSFIRHCSSNRQQQSATEADVRIVDGPAAALDGA